MNPPSPAAGKLLVRGIALAVALGIWFAPVPEGLTPKAWHLFAIFGAAILSVILTAFPLLTAAMIALAAAVLSGTVAPAKAFGGFANGSVLLVVVAFLVARGVVKSGLGRRLSYMVVGALRPFHPGAGLQHLLHGRRHRPRLPEQHRAGGRALPHRPLPRGVGGVEAGGRDEAADGRVPHVLRHGELERLFRPLAHGHLRQPHRGGDRPHLRPGASISVPGCSRRRSPR